MSSNSFFDVVNMDLIPQSWEKKLLKDVAAINQASSNLREFEWINYTDIASVGTHTAELPTKLKVSEAPSRARRILKYGDTVVSTVRPNRKSFFFYNGQWSNPIASTGFAVVSPRFISDAEYLYAVLTSDAAVKTYEAICEGGAYPAFNPSRLNELRIPWPPEEVRNLVGRFLMNLESKIEVNKALSKTLEDIAEALFKSWFIDFDPVKSKIAGEKSESLDAGTAALFPDGLIQTELGEAIVGSSIVSIGDVLDLAWGDTKTTKSSYVPSGFAAYSAKGQDGFLNKYDYDQMGIVLSAIGAGCGRTWLALGKWSCIKNTIRILNRDDNPDVLTYFYFLSSNPDFWPKRGSAQPFIGQEDARSLQIILPPADLLKSFAGIVKPILMQIHILQQQNYSLSKIRDSLSPGLISGDVAILEEILA